MEIHIIPSSRERTLLIKADDEGKLKIALKNEAFKKKIHDEYEGFVFFFMKKHSLCSFKSMSICIIDQATNNTRIENNNAKRTLTLPFEIIEEIKTIVSSVYPVMTNENYYLEEAIMFDGYDYHIYFSDLANAYYCTVDNFQYHISEDSANVKQLVSLLQQIFIILERNGVDISLFSLQ